MLSNDARTYLSGFLGTLNIEARDYLLDELTLAKHRADGGPSQEIQNIYWLDAPERRQPKRVKDELPPGFTCSEPARYRHFKIAAIKALRDEAKVDLKTAKDTIDKWEQEGRFDAKFLSPECR